MDRVGAYLLARECHLEHSAEADVVFHGRGMEPFLRDGDRLELEPAAWADIRRGDIVAYRLDDRLPALRVIRKRRHRLDLRADALPGITFTAWQDDIVGRVRARRRAGHTLRCGVPRWTLRTGVALSRHGFGALSRRIQRITHRAASTVSRLRRERFVDPLASLHLNISAACNLGCRMCPYLAVHDDRRFERHMSEATFRALLDPIRRVRQIGIAGSGEPTLNRSLAAFIRTARDVNPDVEVDLTTNGTMLTEALATELIKAGLNRLAVSIDGARSETVARIRIGIDLDHVLENIRRVDRLKRTLGSERPILRVNYMVGFGTYDELPEFVPLAQSCGIQEIYLLEVLDGTEASVRDDLCHSVERDNGARLKDAIRRAQACGIAIALPYADHDRCLQPATPHVSEDGSVSPCCFVDYNGRTLFVGGRTVNMPALTFGNVTEARFDEIWNRPDFVDFRRRNRRGDFTEFCRTCVRARVPASDALRRHVG